MKKSLSGIFTGIVLVMLALRVSAQVKTAEFGPLFLDSVTVIGSAAFGHQAGNMEIKLSGSGFEGAANFGCDAIYITTRGSVINFKEMFSTLVAAQVAQKQIRLGITNDPSLTAFGGRCSLVSVSILK